VINVITSDQHNWYMRYEPQEMKVNLEIFLTYIAPIHYNAVRHVYSSQQLAQLAVLPSMK
jgi:hypothetical protein